jgi:hypothetical protein
VGNWGRNSEKIKLFRVSRTFCINFAKYLSPSTNFIAIFLSPFSGFIADRGDNFSGDKFETKQFVPKYLTFVPRLFILGKKEG